jgi:hypothetical protein
MGADMFVVAEKGTSAKGEKGYFLTIYKLEGKEIKEIGSTFHRSKTNP